MKFTEQIEMNFFSVQYYTHIVRCIPDYYYFTQLIQWLWFIYNQTNRINDLSLLILFYLSFMRCVIIILFVQWAFIQLDHACLSELFINHVTCVSNTWKIQNLILFILFFSTKLFWKKYD